MITQDKHILISVSQLTTAIFAVFFILLPLIFCNQIIETASLPRHVLIAGIACILLLILAFQFFLSKKIEFNFSKIHFSLLAFYCWALFSTMWSLDPKNAITELTQLTFYFIIAFFASQLRKNNQIKIILCAIYIGASIAAAIGILQAFNINPLELKISTQLASTFNNKNYASNYFDLVIPLSLITMLSTTNHTKYISAIAYTLAVTFILLSKTKGSILGYLVFSFIFLVLIYYNKPIRKQFLQKKKILQYILLSFIIPMSLYSLSNLNFANTEKPTTPISWNSDLTKSSVSVRLSLYKNAYAMFEETPITGVGYGAFRKGFAPYASSPNIVTSITEDRTVAQLHNDPYQILLELGVVGGCLIFLSFAYIIFKSTSILLTLKQINEDDSKYLLLGAFLALISSITHSFVDFPMRLPSSSALFWLITGLTIFLLGKLSKEITTKTIVRKKTIGFISLIFFLLLSAHSYDLYQRLFSASKLQYDATTLMIKNQKNCPDAKEKIDQAISLFPESYSIRHRYAQIYTHCKLPLEVKLSAMNRILSTDSTHNRARLTRATIFLEYRRLKLASRDFNYLIYVLPHRPAAYLGIGDIATLSKDYKTARKYYEKAQELEPSNQQAIFMLKQFNEKGI